MVVFWWDISSGIHKSTFSTDKSDEEHPIPPITMMPKDTCSSCVINYPFVCLNNEKIQPIEIASNVQSHLEYKKKCAFFQHFQRFCFDRMEKRRMHSMAIRFHKHVTLLRCFFVWSYFYQRKRQALLASKNLIRCIFLKWLLWSRDNVMHQKSVHLIQRCIAQIKLRKMKSSITSWKLYLTCEILIEKVFYQWKDYSSIVEKKQSQDVQMLAHQRCRKILTGVLLVWSRLSRYLNMKRRRQRIFMANVFYSWCNQIKREIALILDVSRLKSIYVLRSVFEILVSAYSILYW